MRRFLKQRGKRNLQRFSAMGKKSQEIQRARRVSAANSGALAVKKSSLH
jgi:hypothetical protein